MEKTITDRRNQSEARILIQSQRTSFKGDQNSSRAPTNPSIMRNFSQNRVIENIRQLNLSEKANKYQLNLENLNSINQLFAQKQSQKQEQKQDPKVKNVYDKFIESEQKEGGSTPPIADLYGKQDSFRKSNPLFKKQLTYQPSNVCSINTEAEQVKPKKIIQVSVDKKVLPKHSSERRIPYGKVRKNKDPPN